MANHAHDHADDSRPLTRDDVLSTTEVAELLGIPRSTVHELARRGDLPARRIGRRWPSAAS
jgi:excisionase family DNA binding protein